MTVLYRRSASNGICPNTGGCDLRPLDGPQGNQTGSQDRCLSIQSVAGTSSVLPTGWSRTSRHEEIGHPSTEEQAIQRGLTRSSANCYLTYACVLRGSMCLLLSNARPGSQADGQGQAPRRKPLRWPQQARVACATGELVANPAMHHSVEQEALAYAMLPLPCDRLGTGEETTYFTADCALIHSYYLHL